MPIDCRIVATPPYIYVTYLPPRADGEVRERPEPRAKKSPKLTDWKIQPIQPPGPYVTLTRWSVTGPERVGEAEAYTLVPQEGASLTWLQPLALVRVVSDFALEDGERPAKTVIVEGQDGVTDIVNAITAGDRRILGRLPGGAEAAGSDLGGLRRGVQDLSAFPLVTMGLDGAGSAPTAAPGGQALVDAEIRRVLGRKPSLEDVKGTLALLDRVMELRDANGVQRWELRPGGARVMQADTGAGVTGRQASLAGLASDTIEQITPLVQRVEQLALRVENPVLLETARANFLASATEAAAEAGVSGGPLRVKAEVLLEQSITELGRFGQELGVLGLVDCVITEGGLPRRVGQHEDRADKRIERLYEPVRTNVVTPRDEEQFTTFLIVLDRWRTFHDLFLDYLASDRKKRANLTFFSDEAASQDLGLRFTLLDRRIDVIAEAVDELDDALSSVGIDREERQALNVLKNDDTSATLADLMDWAQSFPEREARPLIQQSGLRGAALISGRLQALSEVVAFLETTVLDVSVGARAHARHENGYAALHHPRVIVAVEKLKRELHQAQREADKAAQVSP